MFRVCWQSMRISADLEIPSGRHYTEADIEPFAISEAEGAADDFSFLM
jgi:hypothetical protein